MLQDDYGDDYTRGETHHEFWVSPRSGYIFETTQALGTSGRQVCETLFGLGSTLEVNGGELVDAIRRLAEQHCDAIDRDVAAYG